MEPESERFKSKPEYAEIEKLLVTPSADLEKQIFSVSYNGYVTPLDWASCGAPILGLKLIKAGAKIHWTSENSELPNIIHYWEISHIKTALEILEQNKTDLKKQQLQNFFELGALDRAAWKRRVDVVELFLEKGADPNGSKYSKHNSLCVLLFNVDYKPITAEDREKSMAIAKMLLDKGATINCKACQKPSLQERAQAIFKEAAATARFYENVTKLLKQKKD